MNATEFSEQRKEYLDDLRYGREGQQDAQQALDRAILSLSAGAFGLSIAILHEVVPANATVQGTWMLFLAWAGFTVSLLLTLISFLTSAMAWGRRQDITNLRQRMLYAEHQGDTASMPSLQAELAKLLANRPALATALLNIISVTCLIGGILSFATFTWVNISR